MTLEAAVRQSLAEMSIPGIPRRDDQRDVNAAGRHVLVCSLCAETLRDRVGQLLAPGSR